MKSIRSQRGEIFSSANILRTKRVFRCRRPQFFVQKTSNFSKFMMCPAWSMGEEVEPVRTICRQGRGESFCDLVRSLFMDNSQ